MELTTQQQFLIVNGLIVTLVVLSFFLMRKGPQPPVKLDLSGKGDPLPRPEPHPAQPTLQPRSPQPRHQQQSPPRQQTHQHQQTRPHQQTRRPTVGEDEDTAPGRPPMDQEISLNVLFNWNGHTWDAYEVLGLPAGSSRDKVAAAYKAAQAKSDADSLPFLKAAYDAILRS